MSGDYVLTAEEKQRAIASAEKLKWKLEALAALRRSEVVLAEVQDTQERVTETLRRSRELDRRCDCRSIWCRLDDLVRCRIAWICNRHDRNITGES